MIIEQLKEIQSLKKRISDLEAKIKDDNLKAFGRSYAQVGSPLSDFLIRTRGQVKIQWGSKFIDLIKDGKINADSNFIYKESEVGVKDGIYVLDDSSVVLKIGDTQINLVGEIGTTYVSFQGEQKTTSEQKYTALTNIGFLYKNIEDVNEDSLQNGIIYIESKQKLYIIHEGVLSEFTMPNIYEKQFVLQKQDSSIGSLVIVGNNIENSIAFDSIYLYTSDNGFFLDSKGNIYFKINDQQILEIAQEETFFNNDVSSYVFKSKNATSNYGFRLYFKNGESTLEVDNIINRNQSTSSLYPVYWKYKNNLISSVEQGTNKSDLLFHLAYKNKFEVGQYLYVYLPINNEGFYNKILLPLEVKEINPYNQKNTLLVSVIQDPTNSDILDNLSLNYQKLQGQEIFLISINTETINLIREKENNIDLIEIEEISQALENNTVISRIGNLEELGLYGKENNIDTPINGYGVYSKNLAFINAQYTKDYNLPLENKSTKLASTEWVHNLLRKGSIVMFGDSLEKIPNGWSLCDGSNNTPNLTEKFIQSGISSGVNYSLVYIMKII